VKHSAFAMGMNSRESAIQRLLATHAPSICITQAKVKGQFRPNGHNVSLVLRDGSEP
jgi:hypothetical protein